MKHGCPNTDCKSYKTNDYLSKDGTFYRKNDSRIIQRYRCLHCGKRFSNATFSLAINQKKRRVNEPLRKLLCSSVSLRNAARILKINPKTVTKKMHFLAKVGRLKQEDRLTKIAQNPFGHMQFDDLITTEHTKMKPLTVTLAVNGKKDQSIILGAVVSQIAAFGNLARKSVQKYGRRKSHHIKGLDNLFQMIRECIDKDALVESDEHKNYPFKVKEYFPSVKHQRYLGGRGCIVGQGELKKQLYDPLFPINHACARLRYGISRLIRKTWNTTKNPQSLQDHLDIFINYHNEQFDHLI